MIRRTARLTVRPMAEADRIEWVRALAVSRPAHQPWMPLWPEGWTPEIAWEAAWGMVGLDRACKLVGIAEDGRIAAWANLNDIVRGAGQMATAGWSVNVEFGGAGYGSEVVGAMLDVAFLPEPEGLGLHRVAAGIIPENYRSLRIAEKLGFRREGFAPRLVRINGEWRDHILFAKLVDEHAITSRPGELPAGGWPASASGPTAPGGKLS